MVEDLINADADINAADNSGKTALHWAAAVNNVDAVNVLLMHGANRDAQDDKVRPKGDTGKTIPNNIFKMCGMIAVINETNCQISAINKSKLSFFLGFC